VHYSDRHASLRAVKVDGGIYIHVYLVTPVRLYAFGPFPPGINCNFSVGDQNDQNGYTHHSNVVAVQQRLAELCLGDSLRSDLADLSVTTPSAPPQHQTHYSLTSLRTMSKGAVSLTRNRQQG
jgi:hypothetical protein